MGILVPEPQRHPGAGPACLRLSQTSHLSEALVMGCPEPLSYNWTPLIEGTFPKVEKIPLLVGVAIPEPVVTSSCLPPWDGSQWGGRGTAAGWEDEATSCECLTAGSSSPIHALRLLQSLPPLDRKLMETLRLKHVANPTPGS